MLVSSIFTFQTQQLLFEAVYRRLTLIGETVGSKYEPKHHEPNQRVGYP